MDSKTFWSGVAASLVAAMLYAIGSRLFGRAKARPWRGVAALAVAAMIFWIVACPHEESTAPLQPQHVDHVGLPAAASAKGVTIETVEENVRIAGLVSGLSSDEYRTFKVIVYVRTDRWRIHPFERGGAGYSFAQIDRDGRWRLGTVGRVDRSNLVALLVDATCNPPTEVDDITTIPAVSSSGTPSALGVNSP